MLKYTSFYLLRTQTISKIVSNLINIVVLENKEDKSL